MSSFYGLWMIEHTQRISGWKSSYLLNSNLWMSEHLSHISTQTANVIDHTLHEDIHQGRLYNLLPSSAIGTDGYCRRHCVHPSVRPPVRLERCSCSNLIKISAISLKFGGMIYSTMEYMATLNGYARPIFACSTEIFHDRLFWPGLRDDVTALTL